MITQTCSAGPPVAGTACVSATSGCNVPSEEGHVPCCATVMAVTAECEYVCVLQVTQSKFLCAVDAIKPYVI